MICHSQTEAKYILCYAYRIVYPINTKTGEYAELILTSYCLQNKVYDPLTDSCN